MYSVGLTETSEERGTVDPGPRAPTRTASGVTGVAILEALGDAQTRQILLELDTHDQDVHSLVMSTGLPQSSVYRKLKELEGAGLIGVARFAFTSEGRKVELYRSRLRQVRVELSHGRLSVEVIPVEDTADRVVRLWEQVRGRGQPA